MTSRTLHTVTLLQLCAMFQIMKHFWRYHKLMPTMLNVPVVGLQYVVPSEKAT